MKVAVAPLSLISNKDMTEKIKLLIANLKHLPGVYLMYNKDNVVIYVGKAKDLYKRVSQYFLRPQSGKVHKMVQNVDHFETIICQNEKEAFVLEMNLIQTYYPRYNILLKDGSHYPYIAIKKKGDPILLIKRNDKDKNYDYFGPFPSSSSAYQMVDLLNKIFPLRKCHNIPSSSCLYYHMGQCLAPCINKIDEEIYNKIKEEIKSFIKGHNNEIKNKIKDKMLLASENLDYESAKEYKKILDAIEHINIKQNVEMRDKIDRDIFAFSKRDGYLSLAVLTYKKGILLGKQVFTVEEFNEEEEQVADLILQYYQQYPLPHQIIINNQAVIKILKDIIDVDLSSVSRGKLYDLVLSAKQNASNALDEYFLSARIDEDKIDMLEELGKTLNIKTPYHIELFDNSHLQGSSPVGAMVAFINGEPAKKLYRKFLIEHQEARDDIKSMQEIIYRHYSRSVNENKKLPGLILVDGGITQIKAAKKALEEAKADIPVFGLFKNDKHQTSGVIDIFDHVYQLENKNIFFLLTRMQDEVHRFAISFHQNKRNKAYKTSILDGIEGLGEKRKEMINRAYPDINLLKNASIDELEQFLPHSVAVNLFNKLHI